MMFVVVLGVPLPVSVYLFIITVFPGFERWLIRRELQKRRRRDKT